MFYFWNVNQLVKDLRAGIVTEYEKMRYLLFTALLEVFAVNQASNIRPVNQSEMLIKALFVGLMVALVIWGIHHCYIINQKNDNKNFIERFICLSVPISIRLGVYFLLGMFLIVLCGVLVGTHFYPIVMQALKDIGANQVTVVTNATGTLVKTTTALKPTIVRMHIFQYIYSALYQILFFLFLGRKIDAVGKLESKNG